MVIIRWLKRSFHKIYCQNMRRVRFNKQVFYLKKMKKIERKYYCNIYHKNMKITAFLSDYFKRFGNEEYNVN